MFWCLRGRIVVDGMPSSYFLYRLIAFLTAESNLEISLRSNARLQIEIIKKLWWKEFVNVLALHLIAITVSGTNFHLNKLELFLYNI